MLILPFIKILSINNKIILIDSHILKEFVLKYRYGIQNQQVIIFHSDKYYL